MVSPSIVFAKSHWVHLHGLSSIATLVTSLLVILVVTDVVDIDEPVNVVVQPPVVVIAPPSGTHPPGGTQPPGGDTPAQLLPPSTTSSSSRPAWVKWTIGILATLFLLGSAYYAWQYIYYTWGALKWMGFFMRYLVYVARLFPLAALFFLIGVCVDFFTSIPFIGWIFYCLAFITFVVNGLRMIGAWGKLRITKAAAWAGEKIMSRFGPQVEAVLASGRAAADKVNEISSILQAAYKISAGEATRQAEALVARVNVATEAVNEVVGEFLVNNFDVAFENQMAADDPGEQELDPEFIEITKKKMKKLLVAAEKDEETGRKIWTGEANDKLKRYVMSLGRKRQTQKLKKEARRANNPDLLWARFENFMILAKAAEKHMVIDTSEIGRAHV